MTTTQGWYSRELQLIVKRWDRPNCPDAGRNGISQCGESQWIEGRYCLQLDETHVDFDLDIMTTTQGWYSRELQLIVKRWDRPNCPDARSAWSYRMAVEYWS
jgi:hypothetical protein